MLNSTELPAGLVRPWINLWSKLNKKCTKPPNQSILFSLIVSYILLCNHYNIWIILTMNSNLEFNCWVLQQLTLNDGRNNDDCNNRTLPTIRISDSVTSKMMFWSVCEERKPDVSAQSSSARDQALFPLWRHNMAPLAIIPSRLINAGGVAPSPLLPRSLAPLFPGTIFDNCSDSPFSFSLLVNGTTCAILRVFWPVDGKNSLYAPSDFTTYGYPANRSDSIVKMSKNWSGQDISADLKLPFYFVTVYESGYKPD